MGHPAQADCFCEVFWIDITILDNVNPDLVIVEQEGKGAKHHLHIASDVFLYPSMVDQNCQQLLISCCWQSSLFSSQLRLTTSRDT